MQTWIIKRNGRVTSFDKSKIQIAIEKAMKSTGIIHKEIAEKIANQAEEIFNNQTTPIADIETFVFYSLIKKGLEQVAKNYESYRAVREYQRIENTTDDSILGLVQRTNEEVMEENSNKNAQVASTQRDLIAGEISKDISRRKLVPAKYIQAHDIGAIHIHDMDYLMQPIFNCCLINLEDMLLNGTVINGKLVEKPKSFITACTVATQIVAQVASNQYGGQSITVRHIAPFLRVSYDKYFDRYKKLGFTESQANKIAKDRTKEELVAGIQTIRYQLSTLQTTNGQAPFVTIYLEIIEGDEFEKEQALICEEMIRQRLEGMKNEKGQEISESFPKLVYVLDEHNCLKGGKYDYITELCAKCNVKRLVPDYQSAKIMRQNYDGDNFPPMGCRSHLSVWKDKDGSNKWYGRFNMGM
ncbi:anaerobic ribonucleoside-triphosphate reductase [Terrisporobacter sp.]|uniref:anaerobic ribonucleoside-triphosphate reductase n=1 Tax=Terrisporobacter sp. TaxID=1965305 RepID=UPI00399365A5